MTGAAAGTGTAGASVVAAADKSSTEVGRHSPRQRLPLSQRVLLSLKHISFRKKNKRVTAEVLIHPHYLLW